MNWNGLNTRWIVLALFLGGFGLGLLYAWKIAPVTYVDAHPGILQTDFKDQYRMVIAASYASTRDLVRARARLELLGDADPLGELSAQAQRMLAGGESFDQVRVIAQLATDLQQGYAAIALESPLPTSTPVAAAETPFLEAPPPESTPVTPLPPLFIEGTELPPPALFTQTPRPTVTPMPAPGAPFALVGQDTVCDPLLKDGLLQIVLMDARRRQVAGVKLIITWDGGENQLFSGLKPELGNGYADFLMQADVEYSVRVVEGGSFVPNIRAPECTDAQGLSFRGGMLLTFQRP